MERFLSRGINHVHQPLPMRSLPIDAGTTGAGLELVVVLPGPGEERRVDRRLRDFAEHAVAVKAAREWMQVERAKSPQYFHELRVGTCLANEISVHHEAALEKPLVARQENPPLPIGQFREFRVVRVGTIGGIEADETQTPGQLAQVNIDNEADRVRGRRSNVGEVPMSTFVKRG